MKVLLDRRRPLVGLLLTACLALAGCADVAPPIDNSNVPPDESESMPLPSRATVMLRVPTLADGVVQVGTAEVNVGTVSLDRGSIKLTTGWDGEPAIRFPAFTDTKFYPRAAVVVSNSGTGPDQLNPGTKDFSWGADFWLDSRSKGASSDNGDNLVQRGIYTFPNYFKAEVDSDHPACAVRGDDGYLYVRGYEELETQTWYRLTCNRSGDVLTIVVAEISPTGGGRPITHSQTGPSGSILFKDKTTPLSVGGKVGSDGQLLEGATDQFNGVVMNPFLDIKASSPASR